MDGNRHPALANVQVCVFLKSSVLLVKRSWFAIIQHESSCSSDKFNSIVEIGANLNLPGREVLALQISSIP